MKSIFMWVGLAVAGLTAGGLVEIFAPECARPIRRDFVEGAVKRIDQRRRDSVRNGLLIGIGSGAGLGFLIGRTADSPSCPRSGVECGQGALLGTIGGAFWGGVAGWVTDVLIRKREAIYLAPAQP